MKSTLIIFIQLLSILTFSQRISVDNGNKSIFENLYDIREVDDYNSRHNSRVIGTIFLYEKWNNRGLLYSSKDTYQMNKLNYNVLNDNFSIELSKDSIFTLNTNMIDSLRINQNLFVKKFFNSKDTFFESLYSSSKASLLKKYFIKELQGRYNPLDGKEPPIKMVIKYDYYLVKDKLYKVNNSKKIISDYLNDKSKKLNEFVKKNKLSLKKEEDLVKVFEYYNNI